ncbi:hypothetical protein [Bradyrhizobium septentrionale]|uniref:Phospholipase D-like domain-containing protein n=1 Tax=Bradyrhizobium septentrionale TaxID=1404411 RepID=A0ABZ2P687_9BRAD
MISAREFCREHGFPVTVFLTYSFDPLFFERIPIDDLDVGGTRRIVIAADAGQIAEAMQRCIGQIVHLGRRYVLAETKAANTFHPKMIVRLSPSGGRVWIGSGNLTYTGWGGNQELAMAWSVGPGTEDDGTWLNTVFSEAGSITRSAAFLSQIEAIRSAIPWLSAPTATPQQSPVLLGMPNRPLAGQLAERWENRRFDELKIFTGSTDVEGAFLRWAHDTFGVKKATICLSPAFASFDAGALGKLPLVVRFIKADPARLMHAKFYWFSGPDGNAAVMGSANCSAAAWLAKHDAGNVELVVPYDQAELAAFKPILSLFDGETLSPAEILKPQLVKLKVTNGEAALIYRIVSLRLRSSGRTIEATIEPSPPAESTLHLLIPASADTIRVMLAARGNGFVGRLPPDRSVGVGMVFATIEISAESGQFVTPPRWIDNEPAIERNTREREVDPNLQEFARRDFGNASQQRILEAIYSVSADLLNAEDPQWAKKSDPAGSTPSTGKGTDEAEGPVRMINPGDVLFDLKEMAAKHLNKGPGPAGFYGVSLQGAIAMLFSVDEEQEVDLSHEKWQGEKPDDDMGDDDVGNDPPKDPDKKPPSAVTTAETLAAFRQQIDHFLFELGRDSYAETCSAVKLMQAVAFPILVCVKVSEAGWLPDGMLANVATRVVDVMLDKPYGRGKPKGLFRQVQARYEASGTHEDFLRTVGEGALWAALLASLARMETGSLAGLIRQAASITAVLACPELIAKSTADQLSQFIRSLIIRDAAFAVTERAVKVAEAMNELRAILRANWDEMYLDQGRGRALQAGGSLMWSPNWGWQILDRSPAQQYCADSINLELAARENAQIGLALDALRNAMCLSAPAMDDSHVD